MKLEKYRKYWVEDRYVIEHVISSDRIQGEY